MIAGENPKNGGFPRARRVEVGSDFERQGSRHDAGRGSRRRGMLRTRNTSTDLQTSRPCGVGITDRKRGYRHRPNIKGYKTLSMNVRIECDVD
jgi:hypothetical protein